MATKSQIPAQFQHQSGRYAVGFLLSLLLTFGSYWLVQQHLASGHQWPSDGLVVPVLLGIALLQMTAQLVLFLHLGSEARPRWQLMVTLFAAMVVVIVVAGSLWIMKNLNYQMNSPATDAAIMKDEGIQPMHQP